MVNVELQSERHYEYQDEEDGNSEDYGGNDYYDDGGNGYSEEEEHDEQRDSEEENGGHKYHDDSQHAQEASEDEEDPNDEEQDEVEEQDGTATASKQAGRGPTQMRKFWKKHGPHNKVNLVFNHLGQPCGLKTSKLSNFIGSCVKGKEVSVAYTNWRRVPQVEKDRLWMTVQGFFNIDECYKSWVLKSASKKWRAFRLLLKDIYYDERITTNLNISSGCEKKIHEKPWAWLVRHWRSQKYRVSDCTSTNC